MPIDDFELTHKRVKKPFNEAGQIKTYSKLPDRVASTVELRRLQIRVNNLRAKVRGHYAKNRSHWVNREIDRITQQRHKPAGESYQPGGWLGNTGPKATDPNTIRENAAYHIESRHQQRLSRINVAYDKMVQDIVQRTKDRTRSR